MAVPKEELLKLEKQTSYAFQNFSTGMTECPNCGEYKLSHRVCKKLCSYNAKK
ncbi:50S ribosomal protein L32 [Staphylococcus aureus]|nr:50S ribosomal protein L32 [Staphylococcus aureus]